MSNVKSPPTVEEIVGWMRTNHDVENNKKTVRVFSWIIFLVLFAFGTYQLFKWTHNPQFSFYGQAVFITGSAVFCILLFESVFLLSPKVYTALMRSSYPELKKLESAKRLQLVEYSKALEVHEQELREQEIKKEIELKQELEKIDNLARKRESDKLDKLKSKDRKVLGLSDE